MLASQLAFVLVVTAAVAAAGEPLERTIMIPRPAKIASALLVRTRDGSLVHTLFTRTDVAAGPVSFEWPDGVAESDGGVQVRLQLSNTSYVWEGVIGNSGPATGELVIRSFSPPQGLATIGNMGLVATGYNEGQSGMKMFMLDDPHRWWHMAHADESQVFGFPGGGVATDGDVGFFAGIGMCDHLENSTTRPGTTECAGAWGTQAESHVVGLDLMEPRWCEHNFTAGDGFMGVCRGLPIGSSAGGSSGCYSSLLNPETWNLHNSMCNGGGNECFDGCGSYGRFWSSGMDANPDNQSATTEDGSHVLADTPTGIAAERKDNRGRLLFVAHEHKNEVRVFDAQTGKRLSSFSSPGPTHLAATTWEQSYEYSSVWVVEKNVNRSEGAPAHVVRKYKSTVEQWANGTYVPTSTVLPNVSIPLSISTVQAPVAFGRTYIPNVRGVIVADGGTSQVKIFDSGGKLIQTIGHLGGHLDGNPTVRDDCFDWSTWNTAADRLEMQAAVASDDSGGVWVTDNGNRRMLRFNATTGDLIGRPVSYVPVSYASTSSYTNASRVFSNFLEFEIDYTKPIEESWRLVRNWAAGLDYALRDRPPAWDGFHAIAEVGGRTLGYISNNHSGASIVELTRDDSGLRVMKTLNGSTFPRETMIHEDGALRYMVEENANWPNQSTQSFYSSPFNAAADDWDFPGHLLANISGKSTDLLARFTMTPFFAPITAANELVIFDSSTALSSTPTRKNQNLHPNQGDHLGGWSLKNDSWGWQASPWGSWDVVERPPEILGSDLVRMKDGGACVGYNISIDMLDPRTVDGRYGANDTAINYGGNKVVVQGNDIVYGFHGEFWKNSEANQFLHFRNGHFVGQFGTPNRAFRFNQRGQGPQGSTGLHFWVVAGQAGNSFSPSMVAAPDGKLYVYHNDESGHGGVHRWRVDGLDDLEQLTAQILP
jgi:hypothetical protein